MSDKTVNQTEEVADALSGVIRCYTLLNRMEASPAPTSAQAAHEWAQTFETTWKEAQNLMAQARALGWRGKLNGFMSRQSPYRARKVYATCYMVRLGATPVPVKRSTPPPWSPASATRARSRPTWNTCTMTWPTPSPAPRSRPKKGV